MTTDALTAFYAGIGVGLVLGIAVSGILAAISNSIEREEDKNDGNY